MTISIFVVLLNKPHKSDYATLTANGRFDPILPIFCDVVKVCFLKLNLASMQFLSQKIINPANAATCRELAV